MALELTTCPECGRPAEIVDRFVMSKHGRAGGAHQDPLHHGPLVPVPAGYRRHDRHRD